MKKIVCFILAILMGVCILVPEFSALSYSGSASYKSGKYYTQLT
jgi:hypothetical protein